MKILLAPDSFKGSLSAAEVAAYLRAGILRVLPEAEVDMLPVADGGEGTCAAIVAALGGEIIKTEVTGPNGNRVGAFFGRAGDMAVIEMAAASGLHLAPRNDLRPTKATTYGTGELMLRALDAGCKKILLGIGGSATTDGGAGMAQALGVRLRDASGQELGPGGGELGRLAHVDVSGMDPRVAGCEWIVASDVSNPLCGENGCAAVYGPQKGCTPQDVALLDRNLGHYARMLREQLGKDVADIPGAGAAGGLGAGLIAFCGATLKSGVDTVLDAVAFDERVADADLVITGEGRMDYQSAFGKLPVGVARRAKAIAGAAVIAVVGGIGQGANAVYAHGIDAITSIVDKPMALEEAIHNAPDLLQDTAERVIRLLRAGCERPF
ncbi:MAG: glycerate kinase [Candidatus Pelethousia sp.]|nr:glycerate kinase [Candidatus Pelethousia sp.]